MIVARDGIAGSPVVSLVIRETDLLIEMLLLGGRSAEFSRFGRCEKLRARKTRREPTSRSGSSFFLRDSLLYWSYNSACWEQSNSQMCVGGWVVAVVWCRWLASYITRATICRQGKIELSWGGRDDGCKYARVQ